MKNKFWQKNISGWLLMLPSVILFGFFVWGPLVSCIRISLYSAQGVNLNQFVGFKNYIRVFKHPDFLPALKNTFSYTLWSLLIGFLVPIILALFISEIRRGKSLCSVPKGKAPSDPFASESNVINCRSCPE